MKKVLITSIGRTGTKSLTSFLDEIPGVTCFHHKIGRRDVPYLFMSQRPEFSNLNRAYLKNRDLSTQKINDDFYIEVNPYLRFADHKMLEELGWEKLYLVRHPKTYLNSVYVRELFSVDDYMISQYPDNNDVYSTLWTDMTRFEKLCWYYFQVHNYILDTGAPFYRFEEIAKNPEKLRELVSQIGIDVKKVPFFELPRINTSAKFKFKSMVRAALKGETKKIETLDWEKLTPKELKTYDELCDSVGKRLGYVL